MKVRWQSAGLMGALALTMTLAAWRSADPTPTSAEGAGDPVERPTKAPPSFALSLGAGPVAAVSGAEKPGAVSSSAAAVYRPEERLVRLAPGVAVADVAADHGVSVARMPGRSGYALLRGEPARLSALAKDDRVAASQPHAVTSG
ncbi:MAG: hypothetical protein AAF211_32595, partial [Myxococcota bacterium]